jgi:hypothetical protein
MTAIRPEELANVALDLRSGSTGSIAGQTPSISGGETS